jgi:predicted RNA-binding Zn-ribbon protein involved in translation (DUF1610 family)
MESLSAGSFVGAGSFRCISCGYALTLDGSDVLGVCPSCGGKEFHRASLFGTQRMHSSEEEPTRATLMQPPAPDTPVRLAEARGRLQEPGEYLVYEEGGELVTVPLTREWTRIGRSLAADIRFDDPTVSRRHALIVRHPDGVRLLDDRSLNGVFVNGARIDGRALQDGDEIIVGRYRLSFVRVAAEAAIEAGSSSPPTSSPG